MLAGTLWRLHAEDGDLRVFPPMPEGDPGHPAHRVARDLARPRSTRTGEGRRFARRCRRLLLAGR